MPQAVNERMRHQQDKEGVEPEVLALSAHIPSSPEKHQRQDRQEGKHINPGEEKLTQGGARQSRPYGMGAFLGYPNGERPRADQEQNIE